MNKAHLWLIKRKKNFISKHNSQYLSMIEGIYFKIHDAIHVCVPHNLFLKNQIPIQILVDFLVHWFTRVLPLIHLQIYLIHLFSKFYHKVIKLQHSWIAFSNTYFCMILNKKKISWTIYTFETELKAVWWTDRQKNRWKTDMTKTLCPHIYMAGHKKCPEILTEWHLKYILYVYWPYVQWPNIFVISLQRINLFPHGSDIQ